MNEDNYLELQKEFRDHVRRQITHDIKDSLKSLENHYDQLSDLRHQLDLAKEQVAKSARESEQKIANTFDNLIKSFTDALVKRRGELLENVYQLQTEALIPLKDCESVVNDHMNEVQRKIDYGNAIMNASVAVSKDSVLRFQEESSSLVSLPEVPPLVAVPSVSIEFPDTRLTESVTKKIQCHGSVFRMGPVQITSVVPKPGAVLVTWEEVDDDTDDTRIFCLQCSNTGAESSETAIFHTVYEGSEYMFLVRDLKCHETYLLRVACHQEGMNAWSPWGLPQKAMTTVQHFRWSNDNVFKKSWSLADDDRLVTKCSSESDMIRSSDSVIIPGNSVFFKILESDVACGDEGLGLSWLPVDSEQVFFPGTMFFSADGRVFFDGISKVMRLPGISNGAEITFTADYVSESKIRVHIENEAKQVCSLFTFLPFNFNKYCFRYHMIGKNQTVWTNFSCTSSQNLFLKNGKSVYIN